MATYVKGNETKKRIVLSTYQKLCSEKASSLTVREIAKDSGCSAAALYRYFDSLDYLVVVASVRFLDDYMRGYAKILDSGSDMLEIYIRGWELFNHYAFERPDVYDHLFWGKENSVFSSAVQDYFELFPLDGSKSYTAYYYTLLFNNDMRERDFIMLRRVANAGFISDEEAEYFSYSNPLIVGGMIREAVDMEVEERKEHEALCNRLLRTNMKDVLRGKQVQEKADEKN